MVQINETGWTRRVPSQAVIMAYVHTAVQLCPGRWIPLAVRLACMHNVMVYILEVIEGSSL